jgi:hypothetical protein
MSTVFRPALQNKLAKLLGMTDSRFDHEALAAVRLANRALAENKLTWHEALLPGLPKPEPQQKARQRYGYGSGAGEDLFCGWPMGWRVAVQFCCRFSHELNPKSRAFVFRLVEYSHQHSDVQLSWLRNCVERLVAKGFTP